MHHAELVVEKYELGNNWLDKRVMEHVWWVGTLLGCKSEFCLNTPKQLLVHYCAHVLNLVLHESSKHTALPHIPDNIIWLRWFLTKSFKTNLCLFHASNRWKKKTRSTHLFLAFFAYFFFAYARKLGCSERNSCSASGEQSTQPLLMHLSTSSITLTWPQLRI